ncbi:MAG: hypothetical protein ACK5GV_07555, partial [Bacteroidota bacterium]
QLLSSGIFPADTNRYFNGNRLYKAKNEEERYMTGLTISWQPKWVKGLTLGMAQASYQYLSDVKGIADILPLAGVVSPTVKKQEKKQPWAPYLPGTCCPKIMQRFTSNMAGTTGFPPPPIFWLM